MNKNQITVAFICICILVCIQFFINIKKEEEIGELKVKCSYLFETSTSTLSNSDLIILNELINPNKK